jgi:hypothetical protein
VANTSPSGDAVRQTDAIEIRVSDPAELAALRGRLQAQPGIEVRQCAGEAAPGEQGVADFLQVTAASGGAVVVAIKTIPEFIKSRRRDVSVTVRKDDQEIVVTAASADEALKLLDKVVND